MSRNNLFYMAMQVLLEANKYIVKYESMPRSYGTSDKLYSKECHILEYIAQDKDIGISEIALKTGKSKSAVSQMVYRMVKKGLLTKATHPENERKVCLILTQKGERVRTFHAQYDQESYHAILEDLYPFTEADFENYIKIQTIINKHLEKNAQMIREK